MLRSEFSVMFHRRRVQVLLFVLALIPVIIMLALRFGGDGDGDSGDSFINQVTQNGVFATLAALTVSFPFFLPMAVAIVAGDTVAGEANLGTLRYLLIRPVERSRLLRTKAIATAGFCFVSTAVVALSGLICGLILFPVGRVTTLSGSTISLSAGMLRIAGASALIAISLLGLAAIGIFVSTLTDTPVAAMATTLGLFIVVGVLSAVPQIKWLHPWLFPFDWGSYADLMRADVDWTNIWHNVLRQGIYVAVFLSAAWANFTSKDVLG